MSKKILILIAFSFLIATAGISSAQNGTSPGFTKFTQIPYLSYSLNSKQLVLKLDYNAGWGYRMLRFKFPDRLSLDVAFKSGPPEDFTAEKGYPIFENIELPQNYLLKDFKASMDEDGLQVNISTEVPLEFEPTFNEENQVLTITIPLVYSSEEKKIVREGVEYKDFFSVDWAGPRRLHIVYVDISNGRYVPRILTAKDYGKDFMTVKSMADTAGALCAVNGGFFSSDSNHQGLIIRDGRLESYPKFDRPVFAHTSDGRVQIGKLPFQGVLYGPDGVKIPFDAVDTRPSGNDVVLLTPGHPSRISSSMKGSKIVIYDYKIEQITTDDVVNKKNRYILWSPQFREDFKQLHEGQEVSLEFGLGLSDIEVENALGAGPMLVSGGQVYVSQDDEFLRDIMRGRAPRTAVGLTKDGRLMLAVLDGRNNGVSIGGTLEEFAYMLISNGAVIALNLDGGGSSAMVLENQKVSLCPGSRPITNSLCVVDTLDPIHRGVF